MSQYGDYDDSALYQESFHRIVHTMTAEEEAAWVASMQHGAAQEASVPARIGQALRPAPLPAPPASPPDACTITGCDEPATSTGACENHAAIWARLTGAAL